MIFLKDIYSIQINDIVWSFFKFPFKSQKNTLNISLQHVHSHAELFFCIEGSIQLNCSNVKISLNKNDICLVPSGINHTKTPHTSNDTVWGSIGMFCNKNQSNINNDKTFDSYITSMLYSDKILILRNKPEFCSIGKKILSHKTVCTAMLLELICNLYKSSTLNVNEEIPVSMENNKNHIERLLILDHIINAEYMNKLSNKEIADRLSITTRQLSRLVLANYNAPLHNLFTKKRLNDAAMQLVETDCSIETICHSVGFSNKTFFYQKFKEEFGVTPVQYRNMKKNLQ